VPDGLPMKLFEELFDIAKKLQAAAEVGEAKDISAPLKSLGDAAEQVKESFSGSWLGYHSRVYYDGLRPGPAGAHFSQEWGLKDLEQTSLGSRGAWREYRFDDVINQIFAMAQNPDVEHARRAAKEANALFDASKSEIESIIESELAGQSDSFLSKLRTDLQSMHPMSKMDVANRWMPKGQIMTRDMVAMGQRNQVPPHIDVLAEIASINNAFALCRGAASVAQKAASHLERKGRRKVTTDRIGTNVFIGHGRSGAWRELKDFVQDRLELP